MTINSFWNLVIPALITIIVGAVSVAVTFYIKDVLRRRSQYRNMKDYLDKMAGLNAPVIYGGEICKIEKIGFDGVVLNDGIQKIFVPIQSALSMNFVLPVNEKTYEKDVFDRRLNMSKKIINSMIDEMMPRMINEMMPKMMVSMWDTFKEKLENDDGEFSFVLGAKFTKFLKDEGLEVKQLKQKSDKTNQADKKNED